MTHREVLFTKSLLVVFVGPSRRHRTPWFDVPRGEGVSDWFSGAGPQSRRL